MRNDLPALDAVLTRAPEFVLIPIEEGVLLDGGTQPELLHGPLALSLLHVLLPLIDGTRTLADLIALTPNAPPTYIHELISHLLDWGVLTSQLPRCPPAMQSTLSSLKRADPVVDLQAAQNILRAQRVLVAFTPDSEPIAHAVVRALQSNGFQHLEAIQLHALTSAAIADHTLLVSVATGQPAHADAEQLLAILAAGAPWLRSVLDLASGVGEIGPIFYPDTGLCLACLHPARPDPACLDADPPRSACDPALPLGEEDCPIWAAMLASEITSCLLHSKRGGPRSFRRYYSPHLRHESHTWPSAATCVATHRPQDSASLADSLPSPGSASLLPFLFEEAIARRQDNDDVRHWNDEFAAAIIPRKLMLNSFKIALPQAEVSLARPVIDLLLAPPPQPTAQVTLASITSLLTLSVGVRSESAESTRRWAPSGGNLGSVEAYIVAREVEGLEPGVYLYQPEQHTLAKLNQRGIDHLDAADRALLSGERAPALLIFTGAYKRIARKYSSFAYKLLHLDAGAASSQCLLVAAALQVPIESVSTWYPDQLERALALRSLQEVPTHVFRLASSRRPTTSALLTGPLTHHSTMSFARSEEKEVLTTASLPDGSADLLVDRLIRADRVVHNRLPPRILPATHLRSTRLLRWISAAGRKEETFGGALNRRSSTRRFAAHAPPQADINLILQAACDNNLNTSTNLGIDLLVQRAKDLAPGVYNYNPASSSLIRKHPALSRERVAQLFFTPGYEDTPLIFWISGDVKQAARAGGGGYQTLLVRAGVVAHRLWMASLGLGLSGTLIAGISSEAATRVDEFIDEQHTSLIAFLCGLPASDPAQSRAVPQ